MAKKNKTVYKFFINYRRNDFPDFVEHIRSWFAWRFGQDNVFMDFNSIPAGASYGDRIRNEIKLCDVVLAVITPNWLKRIQDDPYREDDWVRIEISEALNAQKLVIPVYIKGAADLDINFVPPALRGMLNIQALRLDAGQDMIRRIETDMSSIEALLDTRISRKKEIQQLEDISPAPGLALGYYVNFVKYIGGLIVQFNDKNHKETSNIKLSINKKEVDVNQSFSMRVIIPSRIELLNPERLKSVTNKLAQAEIQLAGARPFPMYAHETGEGYELIDFPTTVKVIEHWLKRRLEDEGLNPQSDKARELEEEELSRFEQTLAYYIDDHSNDPLFRECVKATSYNPDDADFKWLSDNWK